MKILIAGSTGLVGSALVKYFRNLNLEFEGINSSNLDLTDRDATLKWFSNKKYDVVVDAAARVGGIIANNLRPVEFLTENLKIQNNLMEASFNSKVKKLVFLGSSCIYPRDSMQPIKEEYLLSGTLEKTNAAYAIAKIAGLELVNSYRKEYGCNWISLMPTNIYGPHDNFNLNSAHVLPALIRKFSDAKIFGETEVVLWGSGNPLREFLYSEDLASAIHFAIENYNSSGHLNVGTGQEISIRELANVIKGIVGYEGLIKWDETKPDGTPRKLLDSSKINLAGWKSNTSLEEGIRKTYSWYVNARNSNRIRM